MFGLIIWGGGLRGDKGGDIARGGGRGGGKERYMGR